VTNRTTDGHGRPMTRSLKERQREERAALILEAAYDVLVEKGYHEASIDEIAARVGISKGAVYLHFASKEDLVVALLEQQIVRFLAVVDHVIGEATTVRARLEQILLHTYIGIQGERQVLLELINRIGLTRGVIEKRRDLEGRIAEATERIAVLFEEGKRTGELDPAVPTPIMVATFVGLLSPHSYEQLLTSGQFSPAELVTSISHILFRGLSASSSKES
jgi:TetR/AcrR family fatty acid metabolism transcriptional regulator